MEIIPNRVHINDFRGHDDDFLNKMKKKYNVREEKEQSNNKYAPLRK